MGLVYVLVSTVECVMVMCDKVQGSFPFFVLFPTVNQLYLRILVVVLALTDMPSCLSCLSALDSHNPLFLCIRPWGHHQKAGGDTRPRKRRTFERNFAGT